MSYYYLALVIFSIFHVSLALRIPSQATTNANGPSEFNVLSYGAIGDGKQDDTQAFSKAWNDVCGATDGIPTLILPAQKTFLLSPISFSGPCRSPSIHVQIQGTIVAPSTRDAWKNCIENGWLVFAHINNLIVDGSGVIDGQGSSWWNNNLVNNDEHINDWTCNRPRALMFRDCNGLRLQGLTHVNSPTAHLSIEGCNNSTISNIRIEAPANSPNTDGIDISQSTQVQIRDSAIATGDDCIAMGTGTSWINITGVTCGPGHGISIGSLGKNGAHAEVEQIYVKNCTFKGSTNGARIKTWQGGAGYARNITFEDIPLINVENPIIIDQYYYCNAGHDCGTQQSAVEISGVTYRGFQGTSAYPAAITLNCSDTVACTGLLMERIDITSANPQQQTIAVCRNAQGKQDSTTPHVPCLQ